MIEVRKAMEIGSIAVEGKEREQEQEQEQEGNCF
jgi:hypothetical protein